MSALLKNLFLRYAPLPVLQAVKRRHYLRRLRAFGVEDEPDVGLLKHLVRPGDGALDIGANVGWYTKVLADLVGPDGLVTSVEPIPGTFELLRHCITALGLHNVVLHNAAVSDRVERVRMVVPQYEDGMGDNFYMARIVSDRDDDGTLSSFEIDTTTVEDLAASAGRPIAFIKCDVEGHEWSVVQGALALIERDAPSWLIEISGDPEEPTSNAHKIFQCLRERQYGVYRYEAAGGTLHRYRAGDRAINYFFLKPAHLDRVQRAGIDVV